MNQRLLLAGAALCAAGAALCGAGSGTTVRAAGAGPDAQAWWFAGNPGHGAPTPPPPPGTTATDLVVQGAKGDQTLPSGSSLPGAVPAPPSPPPNPFADLGNQGGATAVSALRFTIPAGAAVARLTLQYDGSPPSTGPQVAACRIPAGSFTVEQEGPLSDVPAYDCTVPSVGSVGQDGKSLVFSDIGALANGSTLAFALVPIYPDQEAFAKPGADALTFRAAPPPFDAGSSGSASAAGGGGGFTPASSGGAASSSAPAGGSGSGGGGLPAPAGTGTVGPLPSPDASASASATAPAGTPGGATAPRRGGAVAAAVIPDDAHARVAAGIALLATLGAFAALLLDRPRLRLLLGGRPTLAAAADGPSPATGGLGRFARPRTGTPPSL